MCDKPGLTRKHRFTEESLLGFSPETRVYYCTPRLGFWSGSLFLIAPFPDLCQLVLFYNSKPEFLAKILVYVRLCLTWFMDCYHRFYLKLAISQVKR